MSSGTKIYFDACCFIDMVKHKLDINKLEARERHVYYCRKFLEAFKAQDLDVYTSTLTVAECTHIKDQTNLGDHKTVLNDDVKRLIEAMLLSAKSGVMPVQPTPKIVVGARDLRWLHSATFKPMDALHIATALNMKCTHFVTTDDNLKHGNLEIIRNLGLAVSTADSIAHLLPSSYKQLPLAATMKKSSLEAKQLPA